MFFLFLRLRKGFEDDADDAMVRLEIKRCFFLRSYLTSQCARPAAEFGVISVCAIFGFHDELAVGKEGIIDAVLSHLHILYFDVNFAGGVLFSVG